MLLFRHISGGVRSRLSLPAWPRTGPGTPRYEHYPLLSITDILRHFAMGLDPLSWAGERAGAILLSLRADHGGVARPS
jgi:hypothetical protein